jgi:hypothetical protein
VSLGFSNNIGQGAAIQGFSVSPSTTREMGIRFFTRNSGDTFAERMRIDSDGNVGIGATAMAASQRLLVKYVPSANFTAVTNSAYDHLTVQGNINGYAGITIASPNTANQTGGLAFADSSNGTAGLIEYTHSNDSMLLYTNGTERMRINSSGDLILVGSTAQKATGTTWSNPSDQRLKDNIRDYTKGTAELMQVRVREWEYNGKGGTVEGTKGLGVVADEVMVVLPDTVENYEAKLNADDEEVTAIKKFDATEITWLLVKTVQELKAELDTVKAELATLKGN